MDRRARAEAWWLPLAPALLAGAHLTGLLLFLNPRVPVSLGALARGSVAYGALFALPSIALHLAIAGARRVTVRRLLPWSLTAVAVAGATGDWVHASHYSFFLPRGIDVQLIKTALWLSFAGVVMFYTALLHTIHHRGYGLRSRLLLVVVTLGSVYAMFDRRTNFNPPAPPDARLLAVEPQSAPRAVVVEAAGATLDVLLPLAEQGKLPAIAGLLESGATARLAGFAPVRRAALAASWATGKLPAEHGVTGERIWLPAGFGPPGPLRLLPSRIGFERWGLLGGASRPLGAGERTALPVWEILARAGRSVAVVGLPPALVEGTGVAAAPDAGPLEPLRAGQALEESGWPALAEALGEDRRALERARLALAAPTAPDVVFVRLDGLERAALATVGGLVHAEFEGARTGESRRAADALITYLAGLDAELAALWEALPPPRLLVVGSAYGVVAPAGATRLWRELTGSHRTDGTLDGPADGLLLMRGENVRLGVHLADARIVDLAPTLLYALALPIARDFEGRVLAEAFEPALLQRRALAFVPSYEGMPRPAAAPAPLMPAP